jgi:hypothetical protein
LHAACRAGDHSGMGAAGLTIRSFADAAKQRSDFLFIALCYALVYGTLLVATDFLPYVFDNNESFSAFVHAQNLYRFGLEQSFGLTDEAYGPNPAAHPYIYTHQGNFPRLFAFLLYAAGLRTVESQILVSTFTIGFGSIVLAWTFFRRLAGRAMGNIAAVLLMTDYILSAQWLVNSFKVWHGFLLFAMLVLILNYRADRRARWLALLVLTSLCVGYFDLLMAIFTFSASAVFAIWMLRDEPKALLRPLIALAAGGALSVALLLAQLLAYYGLDGLKQDLALTFVGRNFAGLDADRRWEDFFSEHHIVFWEALHDSRSYADFSSMVRAVFRYGFGVLTPYFTFLVFAVLVPAVMSRIFHRVAARLAPGAAAPGRPAAIASMFLFVFAASVLVLAACFTNLLESHVGSMAGAFAAAGGGVTGLLAYAVILAVPLTWLLWSTGWQMPRPRRLLGATASLVLLAALLLGHNALYHYAEDRMPIVWMYTLGAWSDSGSTKLFATLTVALSIWVWFFGPEERGPAAAAVRRLVPFMVALLAGYTVAYFCLPGYMVGLNLGRYMPVLVFVVLPIAAAMFRVLWEWTSAAENWSGKAVVGAAAALVLIHTAVFWAGRQWTYVALMPPDTAKGYATVSKGAFKGEGFVAGVYAAPVAAMTGTWAYIDNPFIDTGAYKLETDGYRLDGSDIYKWLADRDSAIYRTPRYAMCAALPTFDNAAHVVDAMRRNAGILNAPGDVYHPPPLEPNSPPLDTSPIGCDTAFLSGAAFIDRNPAEPHVKLVARDPSLLHRWSIAELETDFPPFLAPQADGHRISVALQRTKAGCAAQIHYTYRQQQNKRETGTLLRATLETRDEKGASRLAEIYNGPARGEVLLPASAAGTLHVAITPKSESRVGRTFTSEPLAVAGCKAGQVTVHSGSISRIVQK